MNTSRLAGFVFVTLAALSCSISKAQVYDTPETRRQRAEAQKRAEEQAKRDAESNRQSLEQKKAEAMEYLGKRFHYAPNPSASDRIRFYEKIPPSSHSQDPNFLFTPLNATTFIVRGVVMPPPVFFALGDDEYILEIEFPDGKIGYVNVVGCCGIKQNLFRGQVDGGKEYVQFEGTSPSIDEIVAREKVRQEKQAQDEKARQEKQALEEQRAKERAQREARIAQEKAERERARKIEERKRRAVMLAPRIGMTWQQVVNQTSWGKPYDINRTTTASGTREQWVYGDRRYLYFDNGVLTAIQD